MTDCWQVLGLESGADEKEVKRAYARLLRVHNPEEDADGYQRLRAAYDRAIVLVKNQRRGVRPVPIPSAGAAELPETESAGEKTSTKPSPRAGTDAFIEDVAALYGNFEARIRRENWEALLRRDCLYSIEGRAAAERALLGFLMRCRFLPRAVYRLLDGCFGWGGREIELIGRYPEPFVNDLLSRVAGPDYLRYDVFMHPEKPVAEPDRYLSEREAAFFACRESRFEEAMPHVEAAMALCDFDPELLQMACDCYRAAGEHERALAAGLRLANLLPARGEILYDTTALLLEAGRAGQALVACRKYLAAYPKDFDALCLAGRCCASLGEDAAVDYFERAARLRPLDLEPAMYLSGLYKRKLRALRRSTLIHPVKALQERARIRRARKELLPILSWGERHSGGIAIFKWVMLPMAMVAVLIIVARLTGGTRYRDVPLLMVALGSLASWLAAKHKNKKKGV